MIESFGQLSLWKSLIDIAQTQVIEALKDVDFTTQSRQDEFNEWINLASKEMDDWFRSTTEKITESDRKRLDAIKNRVLNPKNVPASGIERENFIRNITFVSILRVRPFRRTVIWDVHYNEILPKSFVIRHAMNAEASLTSGEAAFAAFASESPNYRKGIVIDNSVIDLRGTYFLLDRILGVRTNAIVPIRKEVKNIDTQKKGKTSVHPQSSLMALVVVALPFSNILPPDFTHRLLKQFGNHPESLLDFIWKIEMLNEEQLLRQAPYDFDSILGNESLMNANSILHFTSTKEESPFSGSMIISGQANGASGNAAKVNLNKAEFSISPIHQSLFTQSELELNTYGVNNSYFKLSNFRKILSIGDYHLMAFSDPTEMTETEPEKLEVNDYLAKALLAIDKAVKEYQLSNDEEGAYSEHIRLDIRREIFFNLLQFFSSMNLSIINPSKLETLKKENSYFGKLDQSLRYLDALTSQEGKFPKQFGPLEELEKTLIKLGKEINEYIKLTNIELLTLCIEQDSILSLSLPEDAENYLSAFNLTYEGQTYDLTKVLGNSKDELPSYVQNVIYELSFPENIVALSRAFNSLFKAYFFEQETSEIRFKVKNFKLKLPGISLSDSPDIDLKAISDLIKNWTTLQNNRALPKGECLLPSMLLPDHSALQMSIKDEILDLRIQIYNEDNELRGELTSCWTIGKKNLPLASSMSIHDKSYSAENLNLNMRNLSTDEIILVKKSRINHIIEANGKKTHTLQPKHRAVDELVSFISNNFPRWFGGIDVLALVPLPNQINLFDDNQNNLQKRSYTFKEWNNGIGSRKLFVAAFLQQPSIDNLLGESPINYYSFPDEKNSEPIYWSSEEHKFLEDAGLERCRRFLQIIQQNQNNYQSLEELKVSRLLLYQTLHDIVSDDTSLLIEEIMENLSEQNKDGEDNSSLHKLAAFSEDIYRLKALYSETLTPQKQLATLTNIWQHLESIQEESVSKSALKIKQKEKATVSKDTLHSYLLVRNKETPNSFEESAMLSLLLSNLVRNAIVNSWRYHEELRQNGEKSVELEFRKTDNLITISNLARKEDWDNAFNRFYFQNIEPRSNNIKHGLNLVRIFAERLRIKIKLERKADNLGCFHIYGSEGGE